MPHAFGLLFPITALSSGLNLRTQYRARRIGRTHTAVAPSIDTYPYLGMV
jgi:hypothetical protein